MFFERQIRENQGVSVDGGGSPAPAYVPPLVMLLPWCHRALSLASPYQKVRLW